MKHSKKTLHISHPRIYQSIYVGNNILSELPHIIQPEQYDKCLYIIDEYLEKKYGTSTIPSGSFYNKELISLESYRKDWSHTEKLISIFQKYKLTRKSCIIGVWGGWIGDIVWFASAIYMRGIDFIFIPTTLMSQADSVIWKLAVNFWGKKNLVWAFSSPKYTLCDVNFLASNSKTMIYEGLVEIWKTGLIDMNGVMLKHIIDYMETRRSDLLIQLIYQSLSIKAKYVTQDFYDDNGQHKSLSLGHTFSNYFEEVVPWLSHGTGVCYGILLAAIASFQLDLITRRLYETILDTFMKFFPVLCTQDITEHISIEKMKPFFLSDKISSHGSMNFVLLTNTGFIIYKNMSDIALQRVLGEFMSIISSYHNHKYA